MGNRTLRTAAPALAAGLLFGIAGTASAVTEIVVLSNRADLLSGGDALVEIIPPPPVGTVVDLEGTNVTDSFSINGDGDYVGLVTGLAVGDNVLTVTLPDESGASLTLENHPIEGPVFTGSHLQPWDCTTTSAGLGAADANCNAPPIVEYLYVPTGGTSYQTYDVNAPPTNVSNTTNDNGDTVRNVIRHERGTINRGLYAFAYLHDPDLGEPDPANPQPGFAGKLYYPFGASCNTNQTQGSMPGVTGGSIDTSTSNAARLSRGFAIATTSLNVLGHHCNPILSAETAMMTKEKLIEQAGPIRYTLSTGGSGGAIGQMVVSNAYPGITNGLMPSQMYADIWSTGMEVGDCLLTEAYFATHPAYTVPQKAAIDGHGPPQSSCAAWIALFVPTGLPETGCFSGSTIPAGSAAGADPERDYNPVTNPDGCRATVNDIQVNVLGRRLQDGFAKRPLDNVGVQYGLEALNLDPLDLGKITFAQFIDLNTEIGGVDIDGVATTGRTRIDPYVTGIAWRSSLINDGRGLAHAAIINYSNTINIEIHTSYHAYAMEARMDAIGHADNHAIWHSGPAGTGFDMMDFWLSTIETNGGLPEGPFPQMDPAIIKSSRPLSFPGAPDGATDTCWSGTVSGQRPLAECADEVFGDARLQAGMSDQHDTLKCVLKPIDPDDYPGALDPVSGLPMSDAAIVAALEPVFPEGVCDYTQESQEKDPSVPWLTYENGPGGEPLGDPPVSTPF